jgi:glycosyltransferase involved in cell wall biosynthesis
MTAQPLSVLFFTNSTARGGAEEHMLTLFHGLDRERFQAMVVCPDELAEKWKADLPPDVEQIGLYLHHPAQLGTARRFAQVLLQRHPHIVHSHQFYSSLFASPIAALCRVPVIVETPHLSERWRQGWLKGRFAVDRFAGRFVDGYIAVSEANRRYLIEEKGLPPEKITVIRNGCDAARFDTGAKAPAGLKTRLGLRENQVVLVVAARLEPQKGHSVLLRAMATVLLEFPEARLVCIGEGSLRGALELQVHDLGIEHAVHFVGRQSNVREWLALAEFTLLPSLWEGLPLSAIESLAAGRAVVATSVDGTPEVVMDGVTGFTVPPNDPVAFASAMCWLLRDPGLRARMGQAGREHVSKYFTHERQVRETQDLYLRLWERSRVAPAVIRTAGSRVSKPSRRLAGQPNP